MSHEKDRPRSLADKTVRQHRRAMVAQTHVAPLVRYRAKLRSERKGEVPQFDPLDGGVHARVLFLFEKPGRMTAAVEKGSGSGFISRNNDDPTAEATFHFMRAAKIPRKMTLVWNVIPYWNGKRAITQHELLEGLHRLKELVQLLPRLRTVVLVGAKARRAKPYIESTGLTVFTSAPCKSPVAQKMENDP